MFKSLFFSSIIYVLVSCLSYGGTIDGKNTDSQYIEYGNKHTCVLPIEGVVELNITNKDGSVIKNAKYTASCVVISPRWVLTAAHVIKDTDSRFVLFNNERIEVELCAMPADFNDNVFGKKDIALCYLSKPILLDFYPDLYEDNDEVGKVSSQAGFGATGTFGTGSIKNDNKKRAGSNIIQGVDEDLLLCSVHEGKKTSLEFMIARGDSGGGLFIDQKLAGIHSCVLADDGKPDSDYGDVSGHTRISVFKEWIRDTISFIEDAIEEK